MPTRRAAHRMRKRTYLRVQVAALCLIVGLIPVGVMAITPAGTQIQATSTATYFATDGRQMPTSTSNTVVTTVGQGCGVTISPTSGSKSADPGSTADFALAVTNAGNVSDTLDLTAASAGSWTVAIYKDDNGDGIRQSAETTVVSNTGVLAAGGTAKCLVAVTVPGSEGAASDTVTFTAKSRLDASKTTAATLTVYKNSGTPTTGAYIQKWLVNGEYANTDSNTRLSSDYLGSESTVSPLEGGVSGGKTWFAASTTTEILDLGALFGGATYCAGYTAAYVYSPSAQTVQMWMGSDDGIKVWLNGAVVWENNVGRACVLEQDKTTVSLNQGWNKLVVKIAQGRGSWQVAVKLCDSTGQAVPGLVYDTQPGGSTPPPADTTAPTISNVAATPGDTTCLFEWDTDEPASSLLEYGTSSALGENYMDPDLATHHSITLTDLTPGVTYYVNLGSADAAGNVAWYGTRTVTTTSSGAEAPAPAASAYIQDWLVAGYWTASSSIRMSLDYIGGESAAAPKAGEVSGGKVWTKIHTSGTVLDLGYIFRYPTGCAGYAYTNVYSPTAQSAQLWMGSDDGMKVWVNGKVVWTKDTWRSMVPDQDKVPIQLSQGWNRLLVKVTNGGSGWMTTVKVCDSAGKQLPGVAYVP